MWRVVVNLDPAGRSVEIESLGEVFKELRLRRTLRHPSGEAFAGVAGGVFDKLGLFAALGDGDFDAAAGAVGQEFGHQVGILDGMRQEDQARRLLVGVELAEEGFEHLGFLCAGAGSGVEIAVAPALVGADEEDLNAGLPAFHVKRHHVRLGHAARVDALDLLDLGQRLDPVPKSGGAFEFHRVRGFGHIPGQLRLHLRGLALEETLRIGDERAIIGFANVAHAGGSAALDLEKQTRPGAAGEHRVGAVAQEKDLLELVEGAVHRARAGEGTVVIALFLLGAAMLLDLWKGVFPGDENVRKGLIVTQEDVEIGLELLDEVLFEQQRLGLRPGRQEHHGRRGVDHPGDPRRMARGAGVVRNPRLEVPRLADVKHPTLGIEHAVNARLCGQRLQIGLDDRMSGFLP